jgi:hypothetical protein
MGPEERWLSLAGGACLAAFGLSRLRLRALAALGAGAYLVYRGSTGYCPMREKLLARAQDGWSSGGRRLDLDEAYEVEKPAPIEERALRQVDATDEAAIESFPASDAPSYTGTKEPPAVPIR